MEFYRVANKKELNAIVRVNDKKYITGSGRVKLRDISRDVDKCRSEISSRSGYTYLDPFVVSEVFYADSQPAVKIETVLSEPKHSWKLFSRGLQLTAEEETFIRVVLEAAMKIEHNHRAIIHIDKQVIQAKLAFN